MDDGMRIVPPQAGPRGRGGVYSTDGGDPFFDFDISQRIADLTMSLFEHPATRKHLDRCMLRYQDNANGELLLACTRCEESPCSCGDIRARGNEYMVSLFGDPALRELFQQRHLAVRS